MTALIRDGRCILNCFQEVPSKLIEGVENRTLCPAVNYQHRFESENKQQRTSFKVYKVYILSIESVICENFAFKQTGAQTPPIQLMLAYAQIYCQIASIRKRLLSGRKMLFHLE